MKNLLQRVKCFLGWHDWVFLRQESHELEGNFDCIWYFFKCTKCKAGAIKDDQDILSGDISSKLARALGERKC